MRTGDRFFVVIVPSTGAAVAFLYEFGARSWAERRGLEIVVFEEDVPFEPV